MSRPVLIACRAWPQLICQVCDSRRPFPANLGPGGREIRLDSTASLAVLRMRFIALAVFYRAACGWQSTIKRRGESVRVYLRIGLRTLKAFVLGHLTTIVPCPKTDICDHRGQIWRKIHQILNRLGSPDIIAMSLEQDSLSDM